jgi:hypothetical protein
MHLFSKKESSRLKLCYEKQFYVVKHTYFQFSQKLMIDYLLIYFKIL